jgi:hypothetical protein
MRQHAVGYNFYIAAHAGDGVHQRQSIERTCGVVREVAEGVHRDNRAHNLMSLTMNTALFRELRIV